MRGVQGTTFRRVQLTDANRFGLLGKGAVLLRTSYPDRTSPVLRGAWVLEKLLNTMTSPPPPGVETNLNRRRKAPSPPRCAAGWNSIVPPRAAASAMA